MASSKKYKLHSVDTGEKSVCAFYSSAAGCRNGDKCKFLHSTSTSQSKVSSNTVELSDDSSAVSSESEGTNGNNRPRPNQVKIETPTDVDGSDPFECVAQLHTGDIDKKQQKRTQKKRKSTDKSENNPASSQKKKKVKIDDNPSTSSSNKFSSFVSNLPVASFSVLGTNSATTATPEKKDEKITSPDNMTNIRNTPKKSKDETQRILPESTAVGRKWQKAVIHSRKHQRYDNSYDFARYKENDTKNGIQSAWIKTKPFGSWCESHPQAIAIDCEMCESQDPLSGAKNAKALCRLSVVNAENPEDVLLDTLVKPAWPVSDYRTRINGIAKEHLENVEFTLRHAQAFMMALCCEETVIVGHAVYNDLVALNMEHDVVADSSFLFHAKDSPANATPSLKDTVMTLFKKEMPEAHDSVNDSIKSLECVLHWIKNDGKVELVQRSLKFQKQGHPPRHRREDTTNTNTAAVAATTVAAATASSAKNRNNHNSKTIKNNNNNNTTLASLLKYMIGYELIVELKTGQRYRGRLTEADDTMNLTLVLETNTATQAEHSIIPPPALAANNEREREPQQQQVEEEWKNIRGATIRYIHFPDNAKVATIIQTGQVRERNAAKRYQKTKRKSFS